LLIPTDVNDPSINPYSWVMRSITILFKLWETYDINLSRDWKY
jgi:hypothetical protein